MSDIPFTICYVTARRNPRFEWFCLGLRDQVKDHHGPIHLIVLDYFSQFDNRFNYFNEIAGQAKLLPRIKSLTVSAPLPTVYQGKHRKTKRNYWAASTMRNTGFVLCETKQIAFIDDLSYPCEGWLDNLWYAVEKELICFGAYIKVSGFGVSDAGVPTHTRDEALKDPSSHIDGRYRQFSDRIRNAKDNGGIRPCGGEWLFGCSFTMPLEAALKINGFDEGANGLSFEDSTAGLRLANAGYELNYCPNMLSIENDELHFEAGNTDEVIRFDVKQDRSLNQDPWSVIDEENPPAWLKGEDIDYSHFMLRWSQNNAQPYFMEYDLKNHRYYYQETGMFLPAVAPKRSLQTGQLLEEM
jgi:hypothetical protein